MRMLQGLAAAVVLAGSAVGAAEPVKGSLDWKSAGPMTFGPNGVAFLADTQGAAVLAVETGDTTKSTGSATIKVDGVADKVAALLGTTADKIMIADMAVNPISGKAYLTVGRGRTPDAPPALVRVDRTGEMAVVDVAALPTTKAELPNPTAGAGPRSPRAEAITDLAFVDGRVFVAGLSNEEFSSRFLALPYPFSESASTSVEIYHGAHGRLETKSPIRTFVPYTMKGESYLLAAYTCTPLVKFPISELKPGTHMKGTTIAELGNRNKPLDMIVYKKGGKDYLLLANSSRGVMKIPTEKADTAPGIAQPVRDKEGIGYETIAALQGVMQMDLLDETHALLLMQGDKGGMTLETIELP